MKIKPKIYWDSNCYLAYLMQESGRAEKCRTTLELLESNEIYIVTSCLTLTEVLWVRGGEKIKPESRQKVIDAFEHPNILKYNLTQKIAEQSRELVWDHNIKPKDSIHLATALNSNAEFLETFDNELLSRNKEFKQITIRQPLLPDAPEFNF